VRSSWHGTLEDEKAREQRLKGRVRRKRRRIKRRVSPSHLQRFSKQLVSFSSRPGCSNGCFHDKLAIRF
jgi:hypothetical protein